jgi:hypothetical protein
MMDKPTHIIQRPFFLFGLPMFFILHALLENFNPVLVKDAIILLFIYVGASIFLVFMFWLLYQNLIKAALATFFIMACNFFFGSVYDFLKEQFGQSFLIKFSFILPAILIGVILLVIYLKKSKRSFLSTTKYLNILLLLLILIDAGTLFFKLINNKGRHVLNLPGNLSYCDTCSKPDIYLIIADEYAGKKELQDIFSFDNSAFENELQSRGFRIINNSVSNYNATVYSMASMLNMDYIKNSNKPAVVNHQDMLMCRGLIKKNILVSYLQQNGYSIHNHSFFDLADKKKAVRNLFYPSNRALLTHQTFINRFIYHFGARFASNQRIIDVKKNDLYNDSKIDSFTRKTVGLKDSKPKFVYTHLNMPHHPYFFDSTGHEVSVDKLTDEFTMNKDAYTGYLQYTNKKLLALVDFIQKKSVRPPVIILLGDHGFRQLTSDVDKKYWFMNLNAVYFPPDNYRDIYTGFYDGMSNVNEFRVTLNSLFGQQLPLLKDSTSFLTE